MRLDTKQSGAHARIVDHAVKLSVRMLIVNVGFLIFQKHELVMLLVLHRHRGLRPRIALNGQLWSAGKMETIVLSFGRLRM